MNNWYSGLSDRTKGILLIVAANTLFAINLPVSREITPRWIDPFGLSQLRITFAFISFLLLSFVIKKDGKTFTPKEHILLFFSGIFGTTLNQLSFLAGLAKTSPVDASLIITITPIITMIFAALIIKEHVTFKKASGVFIGMAGAALILYTAKSGGFNQTGTLEGNLIVLISCFVYALYLVIVRPLMMNHSPIHVMKWIFFYGMIISLPFTWKYVSINPGASAGVYFELGYALLMGTFAAYLLVAFALQMLRPTTVSMFNYIQPVLASVIAISIGQDVLNWTKPLSAALIFAGVYLVITSKSKSEIEKLSGN